MELTGRQQEIVRCATRLIAEGGMANLTLTRLAAAMGISEPGLYRHFRSKSAIVRGIIERFDLAVPVAEESAGFEAVAAFIRARLRQVAAEPELAQVMFAEELFMGEPELAELLMQLMHRHKAALERHFDAARASGEIRANLPADTLFRIVFGPVRLLVKQWGMSGGAFDLHAKGEELIAALREMLR